MFRQWMVFGSALLFSAKLASAATIGVAGDSFDLSNPAFVTQLERSGHTFRELSNFNPASLTGLDGIWLDGFSAFFFTELDLAAPSLLNFVDGGGILLVQSPGFGGEAIEQYPFGAGLTVSLAPTESTIRIRQSEPWLASVTEAQLSGWSQSDVPGRFDTISDWQGLADNGTDGGWVTLGREFGDGAAIYTFQDISRMMFDAKSGDALALLDSVFPIPEPSTTALLIAGAAAALRRRVRR